MRKSDRSLNPKLAAGYLSREEQASLAQRTKMGDKAAFERLYHSYFKAILGYINVKVRDYNLGETLCRDTFSLAYENLIKYDYKTEYSFYTFLRLNANIIMKQHFAQTIQITKRTFNFNKYEDDFDIFDTIANKSPSQITISTYLELLKIICKCCAKPHQVIALGFNQLLQWGPQKIVKELCEERIGKLVDLFIEEYYHSSYFNYVDTFPLTTFRKNFGKLYEKLEQDFDEAYPEKEYEERVNEFIATKVKDLPFQLFFQTDNSSRKESLSDMLPLPEQDGSALSAAEVLVATVEITEHAITYWSGRVKQRAKAAVRRNRFCEAGEF